MLVSIELFFVLLRTEFPNCEIACQQGTIVLFVNRLSDFGQRLQASIAVDFGVLTIKTIASESTAFLHLVSDLYSIEGCR